MEYEKLKPYEKIIQELRGNTIKSYNWNENFNRISSVIETNNEIVEGNFENISSSTVPSNVIDGVGTEKTNTVYLQLLAIVSKVLEKADKVETETANSVNFSNVAFDEQTGVLTFTRNNGEVVSIDTALEKVPVSASLVDEDDSTYLVITNIDGSTTRTDVTKLLNVYHFHNGFRIYPVKVDADDPYSWYFEIVKNSITPEFISSEVWDTMKSYMEQSEAASDVAQSYSDKANTYATSAATSASNAKDSETNAKVSEQNAKASENKAASAATVAETSSEQAILAARNAVQANQSVEELAKQVEENTETAVASANTATIKANAAEEAFKDAKSSADAAAASEINAKSSKETAAMSAKESATQALNAAESASTATTQATLSGELRTETKSYRDEALDAKQQSYDYATKSKSYAVGDTGTRTGEDIDNARYYAEQAKYNASAGSLTCFIQSEMPSVVNCIWGKIISEVTA